MKLRVRVLESERAFKRVATMQQTIGQVIYLDRILIMSRNKSNILTCHFHTFLNLNI